MEKRNYKMDYDYDWLYAFNSWDEMSWRRNSDSRVELPEEKKVTKSSPFKDKYEFSFKEEAKIGDEKHAPPPPMKLGKLKTF